MRKLIESEDKAIATRVEPQAGPIPYPLYPHTRLSSSLQDGSADSLSLRYPADRMREGGEACQSILPYPLTLREHQWQEHRERRTR